MNGKKFGHKCPKQDIHRVEEFLNANLENNLLTNHNEPDWSKGCFDNITICILHFENHRPCECCALDKNCNAYLNPQNIWINFLLAIIGSSRKGKIWRKAQPNYTPQE